MITFKQQFDKLTEAYIRGEVNPYDSCACFVGNLLNGNGDWEHGRTLAALHEDVILSLCFEDVVEFNDLDGKAFIATIIDDEADGFYKPVEILELERCFMTTYELNGGKASPKIHEKALFIAFDKTLDLLKQIHESKG